MNLFFKSICQMGIFMICAQAIVHFRPNGSYEKYLKMLVSVMILVQVFLPISKLFSFGTKQGIEESIAGFEAQIEKSMDEAVESAARTDELLGSMSLEEVRNRMESAQREAEETAEAEAIQQKSEEDVKEEVTQQEAAEVSPQPGGDRQKSLQDSQSVPAVDIGRIKVEIGGTDETKGNE